MSNDIGYTVVIVYDWSKYGGGVKDIFNKYGVKWNSDKACQLNEEELMNIHKKFKVEDVITKGGKGKSGIWECSDCAIKIVINEGEDIGLLIYRKRNEKDKAWKDFVQYSKECGALVQMLDGSGIIFRDRVNMELINRINDIGGEKKVMTENFIRKCNILDIKNDGFKEKWVNCIGG